MSRLKDLYNNEIVDAMTKKFGYANVMEVPKLDKIVINVGCGAEANGNSKVLDAIGSIGGPRWCKRDSYMAIISAIDYVAENFNIQMEKPVIKCIHSDKNNQCIKERCPFHE